MPAFNPTRAHQPNPAWLVTPVVGGEATLAVHGRLHRLERIGKDREERVTLGSNGNAIVRRHGRSDDPQLRRIQVVPA